MWIQTNSRPPLSSSRYASARFPSLQVPEEVEPLGVAELRLQPVVGAEGRRCL